MKCQERFEEIYHKEADAVAFCPYRICPLGAHSDFMYGKVTGFAIDKGIHFAYHRKKNGVVELTSLNFEKRAQWFINSVPEKENDWADYLRGATNELSQRYALHYGVCGVFEGSLPIGGLSSSAAVIIVFLEALCRINELKVSQQELIQIALLAENNYVGVSCGKLDQSCEVLSRADHLLYLDTRDDSYELIPVSDKVKPWKIAVFFSGLERSLAGSKFNMRVDEVRSAAYALQAYSGMEYGKFKEAYLRNIPREVFEQYKDRLPENWAKRATHFYTELERVEKGAEAWRRGDIEEYGRLSTASGLSSIVNWETGSAELKALYEISTRLDGVYGGRFSGAGFKGCCMALIDPAYEEQIKETVEKEYLALFPDLKGKYLYCGCKSSDGVEL